MSLLPNYAFKKVVFWSLLQSLLGLCPGVYKIPTFVFIEIELFHQNFPVLRQRKQVCVLFDIFSILDSSLLDLCPGASNTEIYIYWNRIFSSNLSSSRVKKATCVNFRFSLCLNRSYCPSLLYFLVASYQFCSNIINF